MYAIFEPNKQKYMKDNKSVIVFDTQEEAQNFSNHFYAYAIQRAGMMAFSGDLSTMNDVIASSNAVQIIELPENYDGYTINFKELGKYNHI